MIRIFAASLLAITLPAAALAQEIPDLAARSQAAREAEEIARLMSDVQDAVALAQVQYAGMVGGSPGPGYQGAIAYPSEDLGVWRAVIVGRQGDGPDATWLALAEYDIAQGEILSETLHPGNAVPPLEGVASAMAQARYFAPRAVLASNSAAFCLDEGVSARAVTFATLVLPPRDDGTFDAYVLNGPIEEGAIPLGRHYRVGFDQFGIDGAPELVIDTCEVVTWDPASTDLASAIYQTEQDEGIAPTPVHAFLSGLLPMRLGVVTGDIVWQITDGMIAPPVPTTP
ncbi:MAG: hypothetical protein JY451_09855 [Erythrobacter sp.]|nr:MAG: hypothetical protein JY451_09855 [Erythrobacter sp.]